MMEILVLGIERVVIVKSKHADSYLQARYREFPLPVDGGSEVEALQGALLELGHQGRQLWLSRNRRRR